VPLVFAHRGASVEHPEHTIEAYLQAIDQGADGLECDVRLTRDGHLVCIHDRRLERTSNGRGLVSTHTLAQLDELDFGSWHPSAGPAGAGPARAAPARTVRVLTLERLLDTARDAGRPMRLLIETKHPSRYGAAVEERVAEVLRRRGMHEPGAAVEATVMSFSPMAVRRIRRLVPDVPTVMLLDRLPPGLRTGRLPVGCRIAGPGVQLLRTCPELADRLHERGHQVYVWTVNTARDLNFVLGLGVEGVISDRPGEVRRMMDRTQG
jgi:glycerophosphoryl diester phosphodiesterase